MKSHREVRKIKELKQNLFVRKAIDPDRALFFAELIQAGEKIKPIWVNVEGTIIDGRHRVEGHELCDKAEIECEVFNVTDEKVMVVMAFKANLDGPLPPTSEDIEHTITKLIDLGESKRQIADLLGLPASMARKFVKQVESKALRAKLQRAADAVTDGGLTLVKAAEQYEVPEEKVKELLSGRRKKSKSGIAEVRRNFTKLYQSVGLKHAHAIRKLLEQFEDGDVTPKQVHDIFGHMENLQKESGRRLTDWRRRFESMPGGAKKK